MFIDPNAANHFIKEYQRLLAMIDAQSAKPSGLDGLPLLAHSRKILSGDPSCLISAAEALAQKNEAIADDVLAAVQSLQVKDWVYLRDTSRYSIFIAPEIDKAYAVLGLTQPLRNILGGTGAMMGTGLMVYRGQYVCDGIFSGQLVWLGSGYRSSFSESLAEIKKRKKFFKVPASS